MKRVIRSSTELTEIEVTVGPGTDRQTQSQGYYYVYPERHCEILPKEIWDKFDVRKNKGAMHFPNESEAIERIQDEICDAYSVVVHVKDRYKQLITTLHPSTVTASTNTDEKLPEGVVRYTVQEFLEIADMDDSEDYEVASWFGLKPEELVYIYVNEHTEDLTLVAKTIYEDEWYVGYQGFTDLSYVWSTDSLEIAMGELV